jgi:adenylate kinase
MFNIIIFGPPGSGKGTQSTYLIEQFGLKHLSTGDLLRSEIAEGTPLGLEAKIIMDKGHLVPDEVVIGMISNAIEKNTTVSGFLFDGFPRTIAQAKSLDNLLELKQSQINLVLALQVDNEELIKRILHRGLSSGRSDDTNEDIIKSRIAEYQTKTAAVLDYYKPQNKVALINGVGTIAEISASIQQSVALKKADVEDL